MASPAPVARSLPDGRGEPKSASISARTADAISASESTAQAGFLRCRGGEGPCGGRDPLSFGAGMPTPISSSGPLPAHFSPVESVASSKGGALPGLAPCCWPRNEKAGWRAAASSSAAGCPAPRSLEAAAAAASWEDEAGWLAAASSSVRRWKPSNGRCLRCTWVRVEAARSRRWLRERGWSSCARRARRVGAQLRFSPVFDCCLTGYDQQHLGAGVDAAPLHV